MASQYPSIVASLPNPQSTDRLNSPSHSGLHQNENAEIIQTQKFVGTIFSDPGTLVFDIRDPSSGGGGHIQTAANGGTGQSTFNKGDLLVAQASSVIAKLAVGSDGQALIADSTQATGIKWGAPGGSPSVIAIATSSVYTVASNRSYIRVQAIAGGGSSTGGGGAGAGGYGESIIPVSSIVSSVVVTIGGGGTAANNGGNTLFGTFIAAQGGIGTNANAGGEGGSVTGAQIRVPGGKGQTDSLSTAVAVGGVGFFGSAGNPGAWGAGSHQSNIASAVGGYVIITEY